MINLNRTIKRSPKKKNRLITKTAAVFLLLFLIFAGFLTARHFSNQKKVDNLENQKAGLPSEVVQVSATASERAEKSIEKTAIPDEINLKVPFAVQAPNANWDKTHEEACEEAAILMANRYFAGRDITGAEDAEQGLQEIIAWEMQNLGFFESTTADETAKILNQMLNSMPTGSQVKTQVIENPSADDIKSQIADNKLVLVPSAGRELHNPFYKSPGPLYHFLLIKGYTKTQFITNDAGTKRGENYPYGFSVVLDANHDWNGGDVVNGAKKVIVVWK
ncbi:MAG: C39 family peptidase [Candidatus Berkelbacteria bacterium]|nr:C39 family peptidase [Candidatus Berkelbacteria bacterium]